MSRTLAAGLLLLPAGAAQERAPLADALRTYFAAADAAGVERRAVVELARGREAELVEILRQKSFVPATTEVARRGTIRDDRFVDDDTADNPALFHGPASNGRLQPLIVYVPDAVDSAPYARELAREVEQRSSFVLLVPDAKRDNLWAPGEHETRRHTAPLRDLLLQFAIDPDRVYLVGSGRGGHAAWDVGLMRSELWAAIYPCNGGLIHEGGFATTGGVFVENAKDLTVFTVYNTTFDHGIDSCRYAGRLLRAWGTRFEAVEEQRMRVMGLDEAMQKLAPVVREAHPRTIVKRFNRLADGGHHWLQALSRRPRAWDPQARITIRGSWPTDRQQQRETVWAEVQRQCARIAATVEDNTIDIESQGIGRIRIWLDPALVDFERKVDVTLNGKAQRDVRPRRRLEVMLARVHETGDTSRLYWDYADFNVPR